MRQMTADEYRAFLRERPRTAKLATVRADGRPHIAPIWFDLSEEPAALLHWATRIAERYIGSAQAEAYGRRNGVPGELLVRVTPTRVVAQANIAD